MRKHKAAEIILGILYYGGGLYFSILSYIIGVFDGIFWEFSYGLFNVVYVILPIMLLVLPVVFRVLWKKTFFRSLVCGCIGIVVYAFFNRYLNSVPVLY